MSYMTHNSVSLAANIHLYKTIRNSVTFKLHDILPLNISAAIADRLIQKFAQGLDKYSLAIFVEGKAILQFIKLLLLYLSSCKEIDDRLIRPDTEVFDQVKDKRFFVIVVGMDNPHIGIKPCDDTGLLYL